MINKQKLGMPERPKVKMDDTGVRPESKGNGVQNYPDSYRMDRDQVVGSPEKSAIIETDSE